MEPTGGTALAEEAPRRARVAPAAGARDAPPAGRGEAHFFELAPLPLLLSLFGACLLLFSCLLGPAAGGGRDDLLLGDEPEDSGDPPLPAQEAVLLLLLAPPLTHCTAWATGLRGYCLWQPMRGGPQFVLMQMFAWTLYAVHLLVAGSASLRPSDGGYAYVYHAFLGVSVELLLFGSLAHFIPEAQGARPTPAVTPS